MTRSSLSTAFIGLAFIATGCAPSIILTPLPEDKLAIRYRIEQRRGNGEWKPVKAGKSFKRNDQIRLRFMSNVAGELYVLNGTEGANLKPVFNGGSGGDIRRMLGLGTSIHAHKVGIWPRQDQGSAMRFTGYKGLERFLLIYIPDTRAATREMLAIPPGAEDWKYESSTTYTIEAEPGQILFHDFDLKSK